MQMLRISIYLDIWNAFLHTFTVFLLSLVLFYWFYFKIPSFLLELQMVTFCCIFWVLLVDMQKRINKCMYCWYTQRMSLLRPVRAVLHNRLGAETRGIRIPAVLETEIQDQHAGGDDFWIAHSCFLTMGSNCLSSVPMWREISGVSSFSFKDTRSGPTTLMTSPFNYLLKGPFSKIQSCWGLGLQQMNSWPLAGRLAAIVGGRWRHGIQSIASNKLAKLPY